MKKQLHLLTLFFSFTSLLLAGENELVNPVSEIKKTVVCNIATNEACIRKPIVICDFEVANMYLDGDTLKEARAIDFNERKILAFYWHGSCKDKLHTSVDQSSPKLVTFSREYGRAKFSVWHKKLFIFDKNASSQVVKYQSQQGKPLS